MKVLRPQCVCFFIFLLFVFTFLTISGYCQLPIPPFLNTLFGIPGMAWSGFPPSPLYPSLPGNDPGQIQISRELPPGQFNHKNISFYIRTDEPMSILVGILSTNRQIVWLEVLPEDGDQGYSQQKNRIIIPVGSEKLDGQWYEWELRSIDDLLALIGQEFGFITRLDIKGKAFCLGRIAAFSEDEMGERETSYLASFTDERDSLQDYGWQSMTPVTCEYYSSDTGESEGIGEEGYICLGPGQFVQTRQTPKIPFTFISPLVGSGPLFPVTIFTQAPSFGPFPIFYPPAYPNNLATRTLASQLYSTPINPALAYGLIQSIPLYLNAQSGAPYSVKQNIFQSGNSLPQYPTSIDYATDPAYAYLGLE